MKQQFVGFADSDKFLSACDRSRPINLAVTRKGGKPDRRFGMAVDSTVVTLSQVNDVEVLYFEHVTHRYHVAHGQVFERDETKHQRLAGQVDQAARQYLQDHGFAARDAMLSMPRNYTSLDGLATFLKYDKETESYSYQKADGADDEAGAMALKALEEA